MSNLHAQVAYRMSWTDDTHTEAWMERISSDDLSVVSGVEAYDNWRTSASFDPGVTQYTSTYRVGSHEVSDDLSLTSSGMVTSTKWSFVNLSETQTITRFRITDSWYADSGQLLMRVNYTTNIVGGLAPGAMAPVFQQDGFWNFLQLELSGNIRYSTRFSESTNFDVNDFGVIVGGPHNTGSSSRYVRDMTTGDLIDLGSENSNFALGVRVVAVPAPGVAGVVLIVALPSTRRRR